MGFFQSSAACVFKGLSMLGSVGVGKEGSGVARRGSPGGVLTGPQVLGEGPGRAVTSEQTLDGEQDGPDIIQGGPLVFQDVQADVTLGVHIGMVAGCEELHRGRVVRVATGEFQGQLIPQVFIYLEKDSQGNSPAPSLSSQPKRHIRDLPGPLSSSETRQKTKHETGLVLSLGSGGVLNDPLV